MIDIVIATTNIPKFQQMRHFLKKMGKNYRFLNLKDINYKKTIVENGKTFLENSYIKATQVCKDTKHITIADDSGLCVDALNGKPGIYTSRYGEGLSRKKQLYKLLKEPKLLNDQHRKAKFICAITCAFPNGRIIQTNGVLNGRLSKKIINLNNGLTRDPIFIPIGFDATMSKLSIDDKLKINHRGKALKKLMKFLKK